MIRYTGFVYRYCLVSRQMSIVKWSCKDVCLFSLAGEEVGAIVVWKRHSSVKTSLWVNANSSPDQGLDIAVIATLPQCFRGCCGRDKAPEIPPISRRTNREEKHGSSDGFASSTFTFSMSYSAFSMGSSTPMDSSRIARVPSSR